MAFLWWLVIGLVAGGLARFMIPGRQPMGLFLTVALGLVGSLLGGFMSGLFFGTDPRDPGFHVGGLIMSTIGAMIVLGIYLSMSRNRGPA